MRFQQRRTSHFESKVKAIYGTLPCCDVLSVLHLNRIIFRQICALTPDILFPSPPTQRSSWLLRSVFAIRRDTPVDSKVYYHPVFALSQCAQIIDRYKFFSSQPMHLKVISTTIFDRIEWNSKPPSQIKINQRGSRTEAQKGHFFHPWGVGAGGSGCVYSELCN